MSGLTFELCVPKVELPKYVQEPLDQDFRELGGLDCPEPTATGLTADFS